MGRRNVNSLPFFEQRSETATFVYRRRLKVDIAEALVGTVERSWTDKPVALNGQGLIKIALGSKDPEVARNRWSEVHAQVEKLIAGIAGRNTERRASRSGNARVSLRQRLTPKDFEIVEAQVEREVLHKLEKGLWDREARIGAVQLELMSRDLDRPPTAHDMKDAEIHQHLNDARMYREFLETVTDAVAAGHVSGDGQRTKDAPQDEALDWALAFLGCDASLHFQEQGVAFDEDHPDFLELALKVMRAKARAHRRAVAMLEANAVEAPPAVETVAPAVKDALAAKGASLSAAFERWRERMRPTAKTAGDYSAYVKRFISLFGDVAVKDITRAQVRTFRETLKGFPRNVPEDKRELSVNALVAWAKDAGVPVLSVTTINDRAIAAISAVIAAVADDEGIVANPCANQKMKVDAADVRARVAYDDEDLLKLLQSSLYGEKPKIPRAACGAAGQWLPLIAMFSGARLEEIGQLRTRDVLKKDGMWFFDFETLDSTPGQATQRKTESSRRFVPVHPALEAMGFLAFVEARRQSGRARLFHELGEYRGKTTTSWSKWWGRWAREHVAADVAKCFHSFRHGFKNRLVKTKCEYVVVQRILGHAVAGMTEKYGARHQDLEQLAEAVGLVAYPALEPALAGFKVPDLD